MLRDIIKGLSPRRRSAPRRGTFVVKLLLGLLILSLNMAFSCGPVEKGGKELAEKLVESGRGDLKAIEHARSVPEMRENKDALRDLRQKAAQDRAAAADENSAKAYADAEQAISDMEEIAKIETEDAPRDAEDLKKSDSEEMCGSELDALPRGVLCKYLETYAEEGREPNEDELADLFYHSAEHCLMRNYAPERVQEVRRQLSQLRTYRHIAEAATTVETAKRLLLSATCK